MEKKVNPFLTELQYADLINFKCIHVSLWLCWFALIIAGTTIIGYGASNYSLTFQYCSNSELFCSHSFTLTEAKQLSFYVKLNPFYQNNRFYLDSFSTEQLHGNTGTSTFCKNYITYGSLDTTQTVGGYRVQSSNQVHPCGFPMKTILSDGIYLLNSEGGTPNLDSTLTSDYLKEYHFNRLTDYQLSQWTDTLSSRFMNWFTIPTTSIKFMLMGKQSLESGTYQLLIKNVRSGEDYQKSILISETNNLGTTNYILGFSVFAYGIAMLLFHVAICCKSKN